MSFQPARYASGFCPLCDTIRNWQPWTWTGCGIASSPSEIRQRRSWRRRTAKPGSPSAKDLPFTPLAASCSAWQLRLILDQPGDTGDNGRINFAPHAHVHAFAIASPAFINGIMPSLSRNMFMTSS